MLDFTDTLQDLLLNWIIIVAAQAKYLFLIGINLFAERTIFMFVSVPSAYSLKIV